MTRVTESKLLTLSMDTSHLPNQAFIVSSMQRSIAAPGNIYTTIRSSMLSPIRPAPIINNSTHCNLPNPVSSTAFSCTLPRRSSNGGMAYGWSELIRDDVWISAETLSWLRSSSVVDCDWSVCAASLVTTRLGRSLVTWSDVESTE